MCSVHTVYYCIFIYLACFCMPIFPATFTYSFLTYLTSVSFSRHLNVSFSSSLVFYPSSPFLSPSQTHQPYSHPLTPTTHHPGVSLCLADPLHQCQHLILLGGVQRQLLANQVLNALEQFNVVPSHTHTHTHSTYNHLISTGLLCVRACVCVCVCTVTHCVTSVMARPDLPARAVLPTR